MNSRDRATIEEILEGLKECQKQLIESDFTGRVPEHAVQRRDIMEKLAISIDGFTRLLALSEAAE